MGVFEIAASVRSELNYVEKNLDAEIKSNEKLLQDAATALLNSGGKRIRPVFVLLSGRFGQFRLEEVGKIAVVLELIHMASLVHDDVIDNALTRRGNQTVKAQYGNKMAMYTGDYIFAKAMTLLSGFSDVRIHQLVADTMVQMCEGEIEQIRDFYQVNQSLRIYLRRIRRKTALLLQTSCQLGALTAGCSSEIVKKLGEYGYYVGMAYQITDDILDFTASSKDVGKPVGNDIRQGNITFPVLYALRNPEIREQLAPLIRVDMSEEDAIHAVALVKQTDAIEAAELLARRYLKKGLDSLKGLTPDSARKALDKIARYTIERSS